MKKTAKELIEYLSTLPPDVEVELEMSIEPQIMSISIELKELDEIVGRIGSYDNLLNTEIEWYRKKLEKLEKLEEAFKFAFAVIVKHLEFLEKAKEYAKFGKGEWPKQIGITKPPS